MQVLHRNVSLVHVMRSDSSLAHHQMMENGDARRPRLGTHGRQKALRSTARVGLHLSKTEVLEHLLSECIECFHKPHFDSSKV